MNNSETDISSCAEAGSVIPGFTAVRQPFQVCTRTLEGKIDEPRPEAKEIIKMAARNLGIGLP
jgi:hypothetical protein